jgi:hypothetical protein
MPGMAIRISDFRPRQRPPTPARHPFTPTEPLQRRLEEARRLLAKPFKGITTDGQVMPGLFGVRRTGVSTEPIVSAAEAFLAALTPRQRARVCFELESHEWRTWSNVHPFLMRHGQLIEELDDAQRDAALGLLRATLSAGGYETARDIMRLNEYIGEICGGKWEEYGEWLYWISVFGTPSAGEPWGWQIDGHHLIVNCFVLGDQIVVTPTFMGSEPVSADTGKWAGVRVFEEEETRGLELMHSLTLEQQRKAIVGPHSGHAFAEAFQDNLVLPYVGINYQDLSEEQRALLLGLIETYVSRIRPGHAEVRLEEVQQHLADTYFAWMGGCDEDAVFYYRVHSPVVIIEFDHQAGIALDNDEPSRNHIHTVVRTPNGNDYGKDLLRLHYQTHPHHRHA